MEDCCVYWLHLPQHNRVEAEGYVGVTTRCPKERFKEHYESAIKARMRSVMLPLHDAFDRYGMSGIELSVIYRGTKEECFGLERRLRPKYDIGWNKAPGGTLNQVSLVSHAAANLRQKLPKEPDKQLSFEGF